MTPWQLALYRASTLVLSPLVVLNMIHRRLIGQEADLLGRLGLRHWKRHERQHGKTLLWMHGASIGESLAALSLSRLLNEADPSLRFLITSGTISGVAMLKSRLSAYPHEHTAVVAAVQAPIDLLFPVQRFLWAWQPDAFLAFESELWPNMVWECSRRGIPLLLVDGRISMRSTNRWMKWPFLQDFIRQTLSLFSLVLCQSLSDRARLERLGAHHPICIGSVKATAAALPTDKHVVTALRAATECRFVWVAASTHEGEEDIVVFANAELLEACVRGAIVEADVEQGIKPLLVIIPRHPHRAQRVHDLIRQRFPAWNVELHVRAGGCLHGPAADVVIAGYLGATAAWMSVSDVCLVGGSLVPGVGGHNVLEPALLECAVMHGPHVENAEHLIQGMREEHAESVLCVRDKHELARALVRMCFAPSERKERAHAARKAAVALGERVRQGLVERVLGALKGVA